MALIAKHPISVAGGALVHKGQEVVKEGTPKKDKTDLRPRLKQEIIDDMIAEGALIDDSPEKPEKPAK